ncbi:MAG TPA: NAD-dependent epimerase/dehydratase family protein, partial [Chitinophagaceae bacterium]|nr:NAD-dependent epimerase/dehydratase family protein [Chitinophagaceae bacterium]
ALLRKFHEGKQNGSGEVTVWGSGNPRREFLHADDMASACYFLMENYNEPGIINIGVGNDISIAELAGIIKNITGFDGKITWDSSKPDGTPQKLLDVTKLSNLGWKARIGLSDGIESVYKQVFVLKEAVS